MNNHPGTKNSTQAHSVRQDETERRYITRNTLKKKNNNKQEFKRDSKVMV